jgi:hypothetical protein
MSLADQQQNYKKPCLISPRKTTSSDLNQSINSNENNLTPPQQSSKSLTITVTNQNQSINGLNVITSPKTKNELDSSLSTLKSDVDPIRLNVITNPTGYLYKSSSGGCGGSESGNFEKYWFSLNTALCTLMYWNDKYEQDLGKIPLGKYELNKCCQVSKDVSVPQSQSQTFNGNNSGTSSSSSYHNHYHQINTNNCFDFKLSVRLI